MRRQRVDRPSYEQLRLSNKQLRLVTIRQERQRSEEHPVWACWGRRLQVGNNIDNRDQAVTDDTDLSWLDGNQHQVKQQKARQNR
jgi:hypothetical protein